MIEAHAHIAAHGRAMTMADLRPCDSVEACLDRLAEERRRLDRSGSTSWVLAVGARIAGWREQRWPTPAEVDRACGDRPCVILSFDHHSAMAGSRALDAAGIRRSTPDPERGAICRDASGQPTGVLLESALRLAWDAAPQPTPGERRQQVAAALRDLAGHGFVEVHDMLAQPWLGPMLAELDDAGELPCAVRLFVPLDDLAAAAEGSKAWQRERVRLAGGKLFADGSLNSRTAWVLEPYADPVGGLTHGLPNWSASQLDDAVSDADRQGLPLAVHAIGDAAVRAVLDSIERVRPRTPGFRIEHCELIDDADIPRFAALGVCASVQPCHLLYDIEVLRAALPHRLDRVMPWRDLVNAGLIPGSTLLFGSDTPIVRPHPVDSIQAAMHRRRVNDASRDAIAPDQALDEATCWSAFGA